MELDDEILEEFVQESRDAVDHVEVTLIELERARAVGDAPDTEGVHSMFRAFHSMKGSAGFLGLAQLVEVTHTAENLLDDVRNNRLDLDTPQVDAICEALDYCRQSLDGLAVGEDSPDPTEVLASLTRACEADAPAAATLETAGVVEDDAPAAVGQEPDTEDHAPVAVGQEPDTEDHAPVAVVPELASPKVAPPVVPSPPVAAVSSPSAAEAAPPPKATKERRPTIRVEVDKLDALMNLVGELILAENGVSHHAAVAELADEHSGVRRATVQLNRVARSLQDIAMSLRMVPIGGTFQRMRRLVRDLAQKGGKSIRLELSGLDTEVDKNLIEAISDPLVHIVRNAADHGLETPEERLAAGKAEEGVIHLDARHRAGEVWISIRDDGRGLNAERIRERAVERGLIAATADPSPSELFPLIFEPGFSTAATVTDVSGRGVGMDVVQRNLKALEGRIDIQSEPGQGTTFLLRVPLTLAIIEGMLVRVGGMHYTLPLLAIHESLVPHPGLVTTLPDGSEVARVRGRILPVLRLARLLEPSGSSTSGGVLVIVEAEGQLFCLQVDALLGQRQTVVKALPSYLSGHRHFAGCSILPSGEITLILNLAHFVTLSNPASSAA